MQARRIFPFSKANGIPSLLLPPALLVAASFIPSNVVFELWNPSFFLAHASIQTAGVILLAFGFGISLHNLRVPGPHKHLWALLVLHVFAASIVLEAWRLHSVARYRWAQNDLIMALKLGTLVMSAAAIQWIDRRYREFRRLASSGFCFECGYNLTGLTENRCPECGLSFEAPAEALAPSVDCGIMLHDGPRQSSGC